MPFLLIFLILVFYFMFVRKKKDNNIVFIKYDLKDKRICFITAIVFTVLAMISHLVIWSPIGEEVSAEIGVFILLGGNVVCSVSALLSWLLFLDSVLYLKRLKRYGYTVPDNKKQFSSRLDRLIKVEGDLPDVNKWNTESMALSIISLLVSIGLICNAICFFNEYKYMNDTVYILLGILIAIILCWGISSYYYWRQRIRSKYKDDVEIDDSRKNRKNLVEGMVVILFCLLVTVVIFDGIWNVAHYLLKSKLMGNL